jgi:hypothetical protein
MAGGEVLIGLWSGDTLDAPGGISDELLVFKRDGTGYQEYINGMTCYAWTFRWLVRPDGRLRVEGVEDLRLGDDCRSVVRSPSGLVEEVAFAVTEEDVPRWGRSRPLRVLRLEHPLNDFAKRFYDRFGFVRPDVDERRPDFEQFPPKASDVADGQGREDR